MTSPARNLAAAPAPAPAAAAPTAEDRFILTRFPARRPTGLLAPRLPVLPLRRSPLQRLAQDAAALAAIILFILAVCSFAVAVTGPAG